MANFIERLFSGEKKILARLENVANQVDSLSDVMRTLSDEELKAKTEEFKARYDSGESLDDLQVEAFAVAREAPKVFISHFP